MPSTWLSVARSRIFDPALHPPCAEGTGKYTTAPITLDRMNLLFTMTNNQRQPDTLRHPALKLLFLPDEEDDLKAESRDLLNSRLHFSPLRAPALSMLSCESICRLPHQIGEADLLLVETDGIEPTT